MATALNLLTLDTAERRRADREMMIVTRATVRSHGEAPGDAKLLDLSIYGCRLRVAVPPQPGAQLWLRLDGGWPVRATVVWADPDRIGCRFDEPIANDVMRRFTRIERVQPSRQALSASA